MAKETEAKVAKVKRPTARKRDLQNEKRRLQNKIFKSKAKTSIRQLEDALSQGDAAQIGTSLNAVYSSLDKGVKKGVYKQNTASRLKSRLAARIQAK